MTGAIKAQTNKKTVNTILFLPRKYTIQEVSGPRRAILRNA